MFENEKLEVIKAGILLDRYGLVALSGGNVSWRLDNNHILVTPSGMIYEDLEADDILVLDIDGNIIEGKRRPSVDTEALLYIYKNRPDINAIIHTHQPYATAIGLVSDEFKVNLTTLANGTHGSVKVTPFSSAASIDMGIDTVKYIGDTLAVILRHHGVIAIGDSLKQALYSCVYLEEAAKTYVAAKSIGEPRMMSDAQIEQAVNVFKYYGQGKADMPQDVVKRIVE